MKKLLFSIVKSATQKNTIVVLDGVRGIACLSVLIFHLNLMTMHLYIWDPATIGILASPAALLGESGVTLFFVLSGFLLFMPYARVILFGGSWPSFKQFYIRRAFRILPGYYMALLLLLLTMQHSYLQRVHLKDLSLFVTLFMDSSPVTLQKINGPFWTLAVEWQFYLILPILALGIYKIVERFGGSFPWRRWWLLLSCLIALVIWGVFSRYEGTYLLAHGVMKNQIFPHSLFDAAVFFLYGAKGKYLEDFAIGMLASSCYILSQQVTREHILFQVKERLHNSSVWIWRVGVLLLVFMMIWNGNRWFSWFGFLNPIQPQFFWLSEFGFASGYGLCILALLFGPMLFRRPFEWVPLRWCGLISYSLYMWHLPILIYYAFNVLNGLHLSNKVLLYPLFWLGVVLFVFPFSYASFRWVEQPWIHLGERLFPKRQERKALSEPVLSQQAIGVGEKRKLVRTW